MSKDKKVKEINAIENSIDRERILQSEICPLVQGDYDVNEILLKHSEYNFINCPYKKQSCPHSIYYGNNYICKIKLDQLEKRNNQK